MWLITVGFCFPTGLGFFWDLFGILWDSRAWQILGSNSHFYVALRATRNRSTLGNSQWIHHLFHLFHLSTSSTSSSSGSKFLERIDWIIRILILTPIDFQLLAKIPVALGFLGFQGCFQTILGSIVASLNPWKNPYNPDVIEKDPWSYPCNYQSRLKSFNPKTADAIIENCTRWLKKQLRIPNNPELIPQDLTKSPKIPNNPKDWPLNYKSHDWKSHGIVHKRLAIPSDPKRILQDLTKPQKP